MNNYTYHVFNRSVADQPFFYNKPDYQRFLDLLKYYRFADTPSRFSFYKRQSETNKVKIYQSLKNKGKLNIKIFAFCLMPNHYHLLVKQVGNNGISNTIRLLQNSYAKYVNTRQNRHGSLFQSPFKAVLVNSGEQFIHVARYIHLNPLTSYLIKNFTDLNSFPWCSYQDYISDNRKFIDTSRIINIHKSKSKFIEFTQNNLDYQRSLNQIKHLTHQE